MSVTVTLEMTGGGVRPARMFADRDIKLVIGRLTLDSSYTTGGVSMTPSQFELNELYNITFTPATSGMAASEANQCNALVCTYDYTNSKVIAIEASSSTEYADGSNLSAFSTRFVAYGI